MTSLSADDRSISVVEAENGVSTGRIRTSRLGISQSLELGNETGSLPSGSFQTIMLVSPENLIVYPRAPNE